MKRFVVTGLVAMLTLAGTMVQAAEETGLSDAQKDMLRALARGEVKPWPPATAAQLGGLHEKAATQWDVLHRDMLPHGQVVDVFWNDYERTSPMRYETVGDATCWTGHYLAALALRYKVLQEPEVLERIRRTLDIFNKLTVASGVDGYIVRYVGPADSEPYREYYKVYGRGEDLVTAVHIGAAKSQKTIRTLRVRHDARPQSQDPGEAHAEVMQPVVQRDAPADLAHALDFPLAKLDADGDLLAGVDMARHLEPGTVGAHVHRHRRVGRQVVVKGQPCAHRLAEARALPLFLFGLIHDSRPAPVVAPLPLPSPCQYTI